jgi:hypothetical protein
MVLELPSGANEVLCGEDDLERGDPALLIKLANKNITGRLPLLEGLLSFREFSLDFA